MVTKLVSGYRHYGAVWAAVVVLTHCAALGTAAPAGTVSSKLPTHGTGGADLRRHAASD